MVAGTALIILGAFGLLVGPFGPVGTSRVAPTGPMVMLALVVGLVLVACGLTTRWPTSRDMETFPGQLQSQINTHSLGWLTLSFLVSFLWFRIGGQPLFPSDSWAGSQSDSGQRR